MIFCKKNTKIYEILKKSDKKRNLTKTICNQTNLKYKKILINRFSDYNDNNKLIFDDNLYKIIR